MRSALNSGHIFYYLRRDLNDIIPSQIDKDYKRIDDFGIVPVTFINGYYPKAHEHFMRDLNTDIVKPNQIRHISFSNGVLQLVESTGVLWYLHADSICQNVYDAELLKAEPNVKISKFKAADLFYMENYVNLYEDYIEKFEKLNLPSVEFIIKNLGKEYEFLYDIFYDALEIIFWHGSTRLLNQLQFYLEKLMNEEIIAKLPEVASFYWKKDTQEQNRILSTFVSEIKDEENEQIEKEKKLEIKKLKKKIIKR